MDLPAYCLASLNAEASLKMTHNFVRFVHKSLIETLAKEVGVYRI